MMEEDPSPELAPEEYRTRPGEPMLGLGVQEINGKTYVALAVKHESGLAFSALFRPEVIEWFCREGEKLARVAKAGIVLPDPRSNGHGMPGM